jgi:hypothetical protein
MQDDQISQKFIGLTPADMDRLPHLISTEKKFSVANNLVCQVGLHLSRACLVYKGNRPFLLMHSPSSLDYSDFYGLDTRPRTMDVWICSETRNVLEKRPQKFQNRPIHIVKIYIANSSLPRFGNRNMFLPYTFTNDLA